MTGEPRIRIVSGLDTKGPAAILLEWNGKRVLLDAGDGPEEGRLLDVAGLPPLDAVLVTHDHEDHINALLRFDPGCPVLTTPWVARHLPQELDVREIPYEGSFDLFGTTVTTGANGHSPGGVWLHFALCDGLLYTGDFSRESSIIAFAPPPEARHLLADASYGLYDVPLATNRAKLLDVLAEVRQSLLPLPLSGRGADILAAVASRFPGEWTLEDRLADDIALQAEMFDLPNLAELLRSRKPFDPSARIIMTGDPHVRCGPGRDLAEAWERTPEGRQIVFTGHVIAALEPLLQNGLGRFCRWNVHPRAADLHWLRSHCKAELVMPLFTPLDRPAWRNSFQGAFEDQPEFSLS